MRNKWKIEFLFKDYKVVAIQARLNTDLFAQKLTISFEDCDLVRPLWEWASRIYNTDPPAKAEDYKIDVNFTHQPEPGVCNFSISGAWIQAINFCDLDCSSTSYTRNRTYIAL